jgi:23S rRNA (guanosine2251-2'-O)-methyltransferase
MRASHNTIPRSEAVRIYGLHPTLEAIEAGQNLERVLLRYNLAGDMARQLAQKLKPLGVPIQRVPEATLNAYAPADRHQGCVAIVSPIAYQSLETIVMDAFEQGETPLLVFAAGITDVRNLGSIARSAEVMGAHALLLPTVNSARITADAIKTSAGALFHLPVCRLPYPLPAMDYLRQSGISVVACHEQGEYPVDELDLTDPLCIIIGAEDEGIPHNLIEKCSFTARIPQMGNVGSLNVAVATGMLLYEVQRQRRAE